MRGYAMLVQVLHNFASAPVLPFDATAATVFDALLAQLVRVVTRNTSDGRVSDLYLLASNREPKLIAIDK